MVLASNQIRASTASGIETAPSGGNTGPRKVGCEATHLFGLNVMPRNGLTIGLRGGILVLPALQDEPRLSRGVVGPILAENRPKTGPQIRIKNCQ